MRRKIYRNLIRYGVLISAGMVFQGGACLPDNAFRQVSAENIVFTSAIFIQGTVALIFNTLFGAA